MGSKIRKIYSRAKTSSIIAAAEKTGKVDADAALRLKALVDAQLAALDRNAAEAEAMAKAGADIIVCHLGLTTGGSIGSKTALKLADCPALVDEWADAALKVNKDAIIIVHGGPVSMPDDAQYILSNTKNCHGFYGASSMERLPTEVAITEQVRRFTGSALETQLRSHDARDEMHDALGIADISEAATWVAGQSFQTTQLADSNQQFQTRGLTVSTGGPPCRAPYLRAAG